MTDHLPPTHPLTAEVAWVARRAREIAERGASDAERAEFVARKAACVAAVERAR